MKISSLWTCGASKKLLFAALAFHCLLACAIAASPSPTMAFGSGWSQPQSSAALVSFESWVQKYTASSGSLAKAQIIPEGIALAKERRATLAALIQSDPEQAIRAAVPAALRTQLPAEILDQLEIRVSGIGDFEVLCALPRKGGPVGPAIRRTVKLEGTTYRAFVYGRRAAQTSKLGIALQGIAVDGVLALSENALRVLETGEVPAPGKQVIDLAKGAGANGSAAELDGRIYRFASFEQLQQAEALIESSETGFNPQPARKPFEILDTLSGGGTSGFLQKNDPTPWTTGLKKVLIIRVDFSDLAGDPVDLTTGTALTAAVVQTIADTQVAPYYPRSSYGLTSLTNTVTTQLYRLPQTASFYATTDANDQLHTDAETLAAADYTVTNYDRIIVVFSNLGSIPGSFITYGGLAMLGGKSVWVNGEFDFRVVVHELGHTYGLMHAGLWQVTDGNPISPFGSTIEYGDDFDTMGANFANAREVDFNPYYKNILGWVNDRQVQTISSNGVYRVYSFDWRNSVAAPTNKTLALKYTKDSNRTYWIGVRRNFTSNPTMSHGAYVIWGLNTPGGGSGGGFLSDLLDLNTPGFAPVAGVNTDYDAALLIDQNFQDASAGLNVTPVAEGGTDPNFYVDFQIGAGGPRLSIATNYISGGNGNGVIDINECNDLFLVLTNTGAIGVTNVQVSIATTNAGVFVAQAVADYAPVLAGGSSTNLTPFKISTGPNFVCGTPLFLSVDIKTDAGTFTTQLRLPTGTNAPPLQYFSFFPVAIPDYPFSATNSPIFVTNVLGAAENVTVSLYITHPFDSDLILQLVAPDLTPVTLSANHGIGANYGLACFPEISRTTFDDNATNTIANGRPPFIGSYQPDQPLSRFVGKSGTNINGIWQLRVLDTVAGGTGTLQCWSLSLQTSTCLPGGGQCPGVDLAIAMSDAPDPAVIGSNLVYTITVTNNGPNVARGVVVTHNLPSSMQFVSALASQGAASYAGGVVTATLGNMDISSTATVTVTVIPTLAGTFFSSATVGSTDPDLNPLNNTATTSTIVVPPVCDLAVGIVAFPNPTIVGGALTYTVAVTNKGPAVASGVVVSNTLPAGVRINSVDSSQGSIIVVGNVVLFNAGLLQKDSFATATISVTPLVFGVLTATAQASAIQPDPFLANNIAVATTTVGQAADLAISMVAQPGVVVVSSNLTFLIAVTNLGPNTATNVLVSQVLPVGVNVSQVSLSQGTYTLSGSSLLCNLGTILPGATATIRVVAATTRVGTLTSTATVSSSQADPNLANNSASASAQVAPPFVNIVAAGATLTAENFYPPNGSIDSGETVTIQFRLQNVGNVANTNLVATLLPTGGVTSPSAPQTYGVLRPVGIPGGGPVSRPFTFTASGAPAGVLVATLQLQDGASNLPPVSFTFALPQVSSFTNPTTIVIPQLGAASPYPSTIDVLGITGHVGKVTVTLQNLTHTYVHDVNVLLVGPTGVETLLLSHAADFSAANNVTLTFDDAADSMLPATGGMVTGSWKPTAYPPDPAFPTNAPGGPYSSLLSDFNGLTANGTWSLYVLDDSPGDSGVITNGWSLTLTSVTPVNQLADVGLSVVSAPEPVLVGDLLTYTFTVTNAGPATASGVNFSNTLPPFVTFVSANVSQGNWTTNGNVLLANFATLPVGGSATLTAVVQPQVGCPAVLTNTAYVSAFESDIHIGNNRATAFSTVNLPLAGLTPGVSAAPNPVIVGSNLTYSISITNSGPGNALNVAVTDPLPAGTAFISASSSQGSVSVGGGVLVANLGNLPQGATALVTLTVTAGVPGLLTNSAAVSTASDDTVPNNSASVVVTVNNPAAIIVPAGATIVRESFFPPDGTIEPGETVTVSFGLANIGVLDTVNLTATLLASGGVTSPSGPVVYGVVAHGGAPVARSFSFTAAGAPGGVIIATLQLQDGTKALTVGFSFNLPVATSFVSTNEIIIPDHGTAFPYPSAVLVSGLTGVVGKVTVTLQGLTHSFPSDVNVLLAGPGNTDVLLMSHNGGGFGVTNLTLTFDDAAAGVLPSGSRISSGSYQPSRSGAAVAFPPPAPLGPFGSTLGSFNGIDPNGTWALYVLDDSVGDAGVITGGWTLNITTIQPVNPVTDVSLSMSGAPASINLGTQITYNFAVANTGSANAPALVLSDTLPVGFTIISSSSSQGSTSVVGNQFRFEFGTLVSGAGATASLTVLPTLPGSFINSASVSGGYTDLNPANDTAQASTVVTAPTAPTLIAAFNGGLLRLTVNGQAGNTYVIQASGDLSSWTAISTNTAGSDGRIQFTDPGSSGLSLRFYRALQQAP